MLLKACDYDKTFIDNIQYPGKGNYQYEHNIYVATFCIITS